MGINNESDNKITITNVQAEENSPLSTTLIDHIIIPTVDDPIQLNSIVVSSYKIKKAMKCLHIDREEANTTKPIFIFLDSDNKIQMFSIDFVTGPTPFVYG